MLLLNHFLYRHFLYRHWIIPTSTRPSLDLRHGQGSALYPNGEKYMGEWKRNVHHGVGIYRWSNGKWRKGEWSMGKRVRWLTNDRVGGLP